MTEFDYDGIIEIANRLGELGISAKLVQEIKDWALIRAGCIKLKPLTWPEMIIELAKAPQTPE